ncbi:hypothetical protein OH76DRAFT_769065 [Lentinus brumalis]|uniref:Uncharacterized protein n=1 Tax=Lentinus brumalis TaxID=2498619 RepID=A0A371D4N3_9APHY|nr:hypothetical protein OH76DRAFT_769065 [Polyporus brumalis]
MRTELSRCKKTPRISPPLRAFRPRSRAARSARRIPLCACQAIAATSDCDRLCNGNAFRPPYSRPIRRTLSRSVQYVAFGFWSRSNPTRQFPPRGNQYPVRDIQHRAIRPPAGLGNVEARLPVRHHDVVQAMSTSCIGRQQWGRSSPSKVGEYSPRRSTGTRHCFSHGT